jgi:hypothetical protein
MTVTLNMTFDEVMVAHEEVIANGANRDDPSLPLFQWGALLEISELETKYINGDGAALFAALRKCANHDLVMPLWVSRAFIKGYDAVLCCRANSWDEAFERPYPKGKHLSSMKESREKRFPIWLRVKELRAEGATIDDGLFERVGREFGMSKSRANELYYEAKDWAEKALPRKS